MKLIVLTDAEQDLEDITFYTLERWGLEQALLYTDTIESSFQKLLETPHLGLACDDIRSGYRKMFVEQHAVFYCVTETVLTIVRVLSQQMDTPRHVQ